MKAIRWLDKHLEESLLILLLVAISTVMLAQMVARTLFHSMIWPEEFCRYCYIWSVFLSLGYTIRHHLMLRVSVLVERLPLPVRKGVEIGANLLILVLFLLFFQQAILYTAKIKESAQRSPSLNLPMWIMYLSTVLGFGLAAFRSAQEIGRSLRAPCDREKGS